MSQKKKTTFAKLNREQKLREKRDEKELRKYRRKLEAAEGEGEPDAEAVQPNAHIGDIPAEPSPDGRRLVNSA